MKHDQAEPIILGAGATGLAVSMLSNFPIFEASLKPGGICSSYYMTLDGEIQNNRKATEETYRFEIGGGHWIFGRDTEVVHFIKNMVSTNQYNRKASIYFPDESSFVPYPIQNNLRFFETNIRTRCLCDMTKISSSVLTFKDWLLAHFGEELCKLFFFPFHELYTSNLYSKIAPQDGYKSPVNLTNAIKGAFVETDLVGYNSSFIYPKHGLDTLVLAMAKNCNIQYGKRVISIDLKSQKVFFSDNSFQKYSKLITTLPLNRMIELTGLSSDTIADPYTSVLVINLGAVRGKNCPEDHWVYLPKSKSGFHRVGFYSNVDSHFLPKSSRISNDKVSLYIERSFCENNRITSKEQMKRYTNSVVKELQSWGFIEKVDVLDTTWLDFAYTWSWPQSNWKKEALEILKANNIFQVGRFGRWKFQGIADSIKEGLLAGACFRDVVVQ